MERVEPRLTLADEELTRVDQLVSQEWVDAADDSVFAAGTLSGIHTRARHGWFGAVGDDGVRRILLAKCEEAIFCDGQRFDLGANQYVSTIFPSGYRFLAGFRLDPWPVWTIRVAGARLERHLLTLAGLRAAAVVYRLLEGARATAIQLRALVAARPETEARRENAAFRRDVYHGHRRISMRPYGDESRLYLYTSDASLTADGVWYYEFDYTADEVQEDLFSPGLLTHPLRAGQAIYFAASVDDLGDVDIAELVAAEAARRGVAPI
ncbi:MAG TPA: hypothetical protein DCZ72_02415 [Armatimonadetes bacterium]|nr:hypothetical protein [Armatimonadota bacterium]